MAAEWSYEWRMQSREKMGDGRLLKPDHLCGPLLTSASLRQIFALVYFFLAFASAQTFSSAGFTILVQRS